MKRFLLLVAAIFFVQGLAAQALSPETLAKRAKRKNLTVKEWNTDSAKKTRWMDHLTVYDEEGRKIEEIEYNQFGQVERVTCEYDPVTSRLSARWCMTIATSLRASASTSTMTTAPSASSTTTCPAESSTR